MDINHLQPMADQAIQRADRDACVRKIEPVVQKLLNKGRHPDTIMGAMDEIKLKILDKKRQH